MSPSARIAAQIRIELDTQGVSGSLLAHRLGVTPHLISRRMTGKTPFTVDEVYEIAAALDVPAERLLVAS